MFFKSKIFYINRWAGVSFFSLTSLLMNHQAFAQTVVYQDDFEGAVSGWSSNVTENAPIIGTNMLGRFGGSTAETSRTFTVPVGTTALDIEFDLLRFDSWDFYNAANQDGFAVLIDGNTIFSTTASFGTFPLLNFPVGQGPRSGTSGDVDWAHVRLNPTDAQVDAGNQQQELGFTTGQYWYDQVHRFTINVNNPGATVALTLRFDTDQTISDESAGFDNFLVTAIAPPALIEAADNDFTTTPITPGLGGVTASIFDNDTLNGAAFTPADVTATITDDGSLFGATINPDGTVDIPATIAPGIYELVYEICDANDATNCDTAIVTITVQSAVADAHINPSVCGAFLSQSWIVHGKLNLHDSEVQIGSGDFATDPYLYLPIERDAEGRILTYFGSNDGTDSGTVLTPALAEVSTSQNTAADHESDFHVIVYRIEGAPGTTLTADFNSRAGQDYTGYWIEDTAGTVISASDLQFTTGTSGIGGVGEELPLSFTAPADGIAYLHAAIFDPSAFFGKPVIDNYECPAPSLSMTKVADNPGPYTTGDVVTYTYTVENDGDQIVRDIAIADTHNGSDPAPIPGNETLLTDAAPTGDSTDAGTDNSWDVLAPGDALTFTGTYTITSDDVVNLQQ